MRILYKDVKGTTCIIVPAEKEKIESLLGPLTEAEYLDHIKQALPHDATEVTEVADDALPTDRYFRQAWDIDSDAKTVVVDNAKAQGVKLAEIRLKRNARLQALDTQSIKATEMGDQAKLKEVADLKQKLRDLPQTVDLNMSLDSLKSFVPDILLPTQPTQSVSVSEPLAPVEPPKVEPVTPEAPKVEPVTPETSDPTISPSTQGDSNGQ